MLKLSSSKIVARRHDDYSGFSYGFDYFYSVLGSGSEKI